MNWKQQYRKTLLRYYPTEQLEIALKKYVPTNCQNIAPNLYTTDIQSQTFIAKQPLLNFFLEKDWRSKQYNGQADVYMILAESGMGKTTFMLNLYAGLLRTFKNMPWRAMLLPLSIVDVLENVKQLSPELKRNTVLLLDAFDEDNQALKNYQSRLSEILEITKEFPEVIITCRTQFFPSKEEEPGEQGSLIVRHQQKEYRLRKLYISPFDTQDVKQYLNIHYSLFNLRKRKKAEQMVHRFSSLMVRPMLLKYLEDLVKSGKNYRYNYQIYEAMVEKWLEREVSQLNCSNPEQHKAELLKFSKEIAINMFEHRNRRKGLYLGKTRFEHFRQKFALNIDENILRSRSLLSRNAEGQYRFSHQSIFEYFLFLEAYKNPEFANKIERENFKDAHLFLEERYRENAFKLVGEYKTTYQEQWHNLDSVQSVELLLIKEIKLKQEVDDFRYFRGFRNLQSLHTPKGSLKGEDLRQWLHLSSRTCEMRGTILPLEKGKNLMLAS